MRGLRRVTPYVVKMLDTEGVEARTYKRLLAGAPRAGMKHILPVEVISSPEGDLLLMPCLNNIMELPRPWHLDLLLEFFVQVLEVSTVNTQECMCASLMQEDRQWSTCTLCGLRTWSGCVRRRVRLTLMDI